MTPSEAAALSRKPRPRMSCQARFWVSPGIVGSSPTGAPAPGGPVTLSTTGIDAVLQAQPPQFSTAQACEIARAAFGIEAVDARSLGSERDQAFLLTGSSGAGAAVLKVSNPAEDPVMLDMEAQAALHARRCDPGLTIALPRAAGPRHAGLAPDGDDVTGRR